MDKQKDEFTQDHVLKDVIDPAFLSFFKDNPRFIFCYRKATKLLKAIYVITDNLEVSESDEIRQLGRDIVKDTIAHFSTKEKIHQESLHQHLLLMASLFEAMSAIGLISPMNAAIIMSEYQGVISLMAESASNYLFPASSPKLTQGMFELKNEYESNFDRSKERAFDPQYKGHKGQGIISSLKTDLSLRTLKDKRALESASSSNSRSRLIKDKSLVERPSRATKGGSEREQIIIKEIRQKNSVTVKDIATLIKGVSEKTIQRELVSLVLRGVLKREGERRWSRYLLA